MCVDVFIGGEFIGSVTRSNGGAAYAYAPGGLPLGSYADADAAIRGLIRFHEQDATAPAEAA